jgi:hypothetical protein
MSASEVFHLLVASNFCVDPRLSGRALVFFPYIPFFATLIGATALSIFTVAFIRATRGTQSAVVSVRIQLVCLALLNERLCNARSVFRRNSVVINNLELRSQVYA